nr:uncharacterized protein LOC127339370 [Lolium perenne]
MVKVCVAGGTFFVVQVVGAGKVCVAAAEGEGQEVRDEGGVLVAGRPTAFPDAADEAPGEVRFRVVESRRRSSLGTSSAAATARRPAAIAPVDPSLGSATSVVLGASPTLSRVVVEATPAASPSVTAEEPAVRPLIAAGLEPRFKPADAALEASSSGPQSRWAWFGRAVMAVQKAPRCVPIDNSIRSREIDQVPYRSRVIFTAAARPCVVVEATSAASPSVAAEEPAVRPLIAAGLEPRFKPADAALEVSSSGPQSRWVWFGRAVMAVQKAPRCVPIVNMQQSAAVTPASLQLTTGLLALGPMHRPAEGQADGTKGASSSTPSSPAKGDSPGAAVIQGATSPSTPVLTTSSPSPAWSPPPSTKDKSFS